MSTITDFGEWLDGLDLNYWGDIESLADSVSLTTQMGMFNTTQAPNADRWFVKADDYDTTLMLGSDLAKTTFLRYIDTRYCYGEGIEAWCSVARSMEKDD